MAPSSLRTQLNKAVSYIEGDDVDRQHQGAMLIRIAVTDTKHKADANEAGAVAALIALLRYGHAHPISVIALEGLACLLAENADGREAFRKAQGHKPIVDIMSADPFSQAAHRCLLILQIVADKEADRKALMQHECAKRLGYFLTPQMLEEKTEHALSTICNLAAGSQVVKQNILESGLIRALLMYLKPGNTSTHRQIASLAIRNLSRNVSCKRLIVDEGGVPLLLDFLSDGLEALQVTRRCEAHYCKSSKGSSKESVVPGVMAVDIDRGLIILLEDKRGKYSKALPSSLHMDANAERYSLIMKAVKFNTLNDNHSMQVSFDVDGTGALKPGCSDASPKYLRKITITEPPTSQDYHCFEADRLSELMTKLINKLYTQMELTDSFAMAYPHAA